MRPRVHGHARLPRRPEGTAAAIDAAGWYHTGDLASIDGRGCLRIEGRIKDKIIRGGANIYPREIEEALFAHPAVAEVAVVGVPDRTWGEVIAAFVRPVFGQPAPTPEEPRAWCLERLAPYKAPQHWVFTDAFPLTPSGKVQKFRSSSCAKTSPSTSPGNAGPRLYPTIRLIRRAALGVPRPEAGSQPRWAW